MTKIETNSELALVLPVLFGNERALSNELLGLACDKKSFSLQDGRAVIPTSMETLADDVAFFNLSSRIAERVWLQLGSARTEDFDQLFEETRRIPWNKYLNKDAAFTVTGYSRSSALTSVPACQRVIKKAIVKSLLTAGGCRRMPSYLKTLHEVSMRYKFSLVDDVLSLMIDTSGEPLHKRSYRRKSNLAPLRETTAAALLEYSYLTNVLRHGGMVIDLFTGSGTLIIEAAQIALDLAPGRLRTFAAEDLQQSDQGLLKTSAGKSEKKNPIIDPKDKTRFLALDIDAGAVEAAQANARSAQVDELIKFERQDSTKIDFTEVLELAAGREILFLANPPYGERMEDEEEARSIAVRLGRWLARPFARAENQAFFIIDYC